MLEKKWKNKMWKQCIKLKCLKKRSLLVGSLRRKANGNVHIVRINRREPQLWRIQSIDDLDVTNGGDKWKQLLWLTDVRTCCKLASRPNASWAPAAAALPSSSVAAVTLCAQSSEANKTLQKITGFCIPVQQHTDNTLLVLRKHRYYYSNNNYILWCNIIIIS